ncbi:hypothetical protein DPEC_G00245780 [Dallia pectoralis]|uniref:Uncharacterized protein n=1 Tax=Dallia pectoralis TaxID=75939 RepID=A0ACC2FW76_DALPE|nr:hypothetical protein DPEC_G00245780 [Dallia pectoralis]
MSYTASTAPEVAISIGTRYQYRRVLLSLPPICHLPTSDSCLMSRPSVRSPPRDSPIETSAFARPKSRAVTDLLRVFSYSVTPLRRSRFPASHASISHVATMADTSQDLVGVRSDPGRTAGSECAHSVTQWPACAFGKRCCLVNCKCMSYYRALLCCFKL